MTTSRELAEKIQVKKLYIAALAICMAIELFLMWKLKFSLLVVILSFTCGCRGSFLTSYRENNKSIANLKQ